MGSAWSGIPQRGRVPWSHGQGAAGTRSAMVDVVPRWASWRAAPQLSSMPRSLVRDRPRRNGMPVPPPHPALVGEHFRGVWFSALLTHQLGCHKPLPLLPKTSNLRDWPIPSHPPGLADGDT